MITGQTCLNSPKRKKNMFFFFRVSVYVCSRHATVSGILLVCINAKRIRRTTKKKTFFLSSVVFCDDSSSTVYTCRLTYTFWDHWLCVRCATTNCFDGIVQIFHVLLWLSLMLSGRYSNRTQLMYIGVDLDAATYCLVSSSFIRQIHTYFVSLRWCIRCQFVREKKRNK